MHSFFETNKKKTKWDETTFNEIIIYIHKIASKFCKEYDIIKTYFGAQNKENFLTTFIKTFLEENFGKAVAREAINGHGKVDIMLFFKNNIQHPIECKRYDGEHSLKMLYQQINRHTTVDNKTVSMIIYCESKNFTQSIINIIKWMNNNISFIKPPILNFNNYSNVFKGKFKHDYGHIMILHCAFYHLYFDQDHAKRKPKK
ncbi:hypothetical protein [Candidatus Phytoplasma solani]|uniref:Uncharacterized protein n=1 Tax=Candidatus Phytoplasma solani TaxID=69896 RepID=A0A421NZ00_9MOLU|nr:hypothetical protein [Candidatus Phytoplasma solani]RMI87603.1 hypothetical protein PSSA1_v1c6940 [Candidatus Phytoplasma solani]RMI89226.1 hypothetical protein PSSA1_v1c1060 [Candidatus Phytoplasma solani]